MTLKCKVCQKVGEDDLFHKGKGGKPIGICNVCFAARQREWYHANKELVSIRRSAKLLLRKARTHNIKLSIVLNGETV